MNTEIENAEIVKQPLAIGRPVEPEAQRSAGAQARVEAVADLIKAAMARAGTLQLIKDESEKLLADFPDSDFQPGAGGKENLLYIEHAALRDRFNLVLGLGQWALIVRETWNEDFKTAKGQTGVRVYSRAMMLIRGCYVGEAVGDMDYYPGNAAQNYGDAFEGAKTAAFRRCAKEFGVGLQAWRRGFGDGWRERRYAAMEKAQEAKFSPRAAVKPAAAAPNGNSEKPLTDRITAMTKWIYEQLGSEVAGWTIPYLRSHTPDGGEKTSALMPNEDLTALSAGMLDVIKSDPLGFLDRVKAFARPTLHPPAQNEAGAEPKGNGDSKSKDAKAGAGKPAPAVSKDLWWKEIEIHFGQNKGTKLGDIDTKTLFGWWANWKPANEILDPDVSRMISTTPTSNFDEELREALNACGEHYNFQKKN